MGDDCKTPRHALLSGGRKLEQPGVHSFLNGARRRGSANPSQSTRNPREFAASEAPGILRCFLTGMSMKVLVEEGHAIIIISGDSAAVKPAPCCCFQDVAASLNNVAAALKCKGKFEAAEPMFWRAHKVRRDSRDGKPLYHALLYRGNSFSLSSFFCGKCSRKWQGKGIRLSALTISPKMWGYFAWLCRSERQLLGARTSKLHKR